MTGFRSYLILNPSKAFPFVLVIVLLGIGFRVQAQNTAKNEQQLCPPPFPKAKFYIESQPDSPMLIRDMSAELVQNPNDTMAFNNIQITFYFENRSAKKIKQYIWDNPMPDESKWPSGGIDARILLPGESQRYQNTFHTQQGPSVVFRISEVEFVDGTKWKAKRYNRAYALNSTPVCVVTEKWSNPQRKRTIASDGWSVPVFADRITKTINTDPIVIDGIKVGTKLYEISRERLDSIQYCSPDAIFQKVIGTDRDFDFDIEKYRSFAINGRIFAYRIDYDFVDEHGQYEIGASSSSLYVDKEGNGKFTLQCGDKPSLMIPQWAKNLAIPK